MTRITTRLKAGWRFTRTETPNAVTPDCDDSGWEQVEVPHDWAIAGLDRRYQLQDPPCFPGKVSHAHLLGMQRPLIQTDCYYPPLPPCSMPHRSSLMHYL